MAQQTRQKPDKHRTKLLNTISSTLETVPQIQRLYVKEEPGSVSVLAVVSEKDFSVERAIYERQLEIIDALPGFKFILRVISLRGRNLPDVVTSLGTPTFQRSIKDVTNSHH